MKVEQWVTYERDRQHENEVVHNKHNVKEVRTDMRLTWYGHKTEGTSNLYDLA